MLELASLTVAPLHDPFLPLYRIHLRSSAKKAQHGTPEPFCHIALIKYLSWTEPNAGEKNIRNDQTEMEWKYIAKIMCAAVNICMGRKERNEKKTCGWRKEEKFPGRMQALYWDQESSPYTHQQRKSSVEDIIKTNQRARGKYISTWIIKDCTIFLIEQLPRDVVKIKVSKERSWGKREKKQLVR